jgi:AraC-like DNA-binding protein
MRHEVASHIVFDHDPRSPLGEVRMVGDLCDSTGVPERRVFGFYAVVLVTAGQGQFRDDTGFSCRLIPGDLLILFPEVGHVYGPDRENYWDEMFVVFEGAMFDLWRARGVLNPAAPHVRLGRSDYWQKRLSVALWTSANPGRDASLSRLCRFQELLAEMLAQGSLNSTEGDWLSRATARLQVSISGSVDYRALSADFGMSYETFRKRFAKEAGVSPGRYVKQLRMRLACELLLRRSAPVKEIGLELGFCDEFHFSRQFKKNVGMTPTAFRKFFR